MRHSTQTTIAPFEPYPSITDAHFKEKLLKKREFLDNFYDRVEHQSTIVGDMDYNDRWIESCNLPSSKVGGVKTSTKASVNGAPDKSREPKGFRLTSSQRFLKNFMAPGTPYNGLLLFHGTGVGKTCTAVNICENFPNRRVYVISSPTLHANFKQTIVNTSIKPLSSSAQCLGSKYFDSVINREGLVQGHGYGRALEQRIITQINRKLRNKYSFFGTIQFANFVSQMQDAEIVDMFSGGIFVIDEAHQLRNINERATFSALERVLTLTTQTKLILLTATPMFNSYIDIIPLLTLLHKNDGRLNSINVNTIFKHRDPKTGALLDFDEDAMMKLTKGYISYIRGQSPFSFPIRLSPILSGDKNIYDGSWAPKNDIFGAPIPIKWRLDRLWKICPAIESWGICLSTMSSEQKSIYTDYVKNIEFKDAPESGSIQDDDGFVDNDGVDEEGDEMNAIQLDSSRSAVITAHQACNIVFPVGQMRIGKLGFDACFTYDRQSKWWKYRSADIPRFLESGSLPQYSCKIATIVDRLVSASSKGCVSIVYSRWIWSGIMPVALALEHRGFSRYNPHEQSFKSSKQYAIISGDRSLSTIGLDALLKVVRSSKNMNGERISVILMTDRGTEGLDFRFVRELHVMEPWFHMNKIEQVIGRAARTCSHALLPTEDRNVTIYLHGASMSSNQESIDLRFYRIALRKDNDIRKVESCLCVNAIDYEAQYAIETHLNSARMLNMYVDIKTSVGVVLKKYMIGYRDKDVKSTSSPKVFKFTTTTPDISTYDIEKHRDVTADRLMVESFFREHDIGTIDDIIDFLSLRHTVDRESILHILNGPARVLMFDKANDVKMSNRISSSMNKSLSSKHNYFEIVHRTNLYMLKNISVDNKYSIDNNNSILLRVSDHPRNNIDNMDHSLKITSTDVTKFINPKLEGVDNPFAHDKKHESVDIKMKVVEIENKMNLPPEVTHALYPQLIDFVIDRLPHRELITIVTESFLGYQNAKKEPSIIKLIRTSLMNGLMVLKHEQTIVFRSPYKPKDVLCAVPNNKNGSKGSQKFVKCLAGEIPIEILSSTNNISKDGSGFKHEALEFAHADTGLLVIGGFMSRSASLEEPHIFKLVTVNNKNGSVCEATSTFKVGKIIQSIYNMLSLFVANRSSLSKDDEVIIYFITKLFASKFRFNDKHDIFGSIDKKYSSKFKANIVFPTLNKTMCCRLMELVLRRFFPDRFERPLQRKV